MLFWKLLTAPLEHLKSSRVQKSSCPLRYLQARVGAIMQVQHLQQILWMPQTFRRQHASDLRVADSLAALKMDLGNLHSKLSYRVSI